MSLTYAISTVTVFLEKFYHNFLLFFTDFELLILHNNIVKISEILNRWVELVVSLHPNYLPYRFLHNLQPFSLWEKWNFSIFFNFYWLEYFFGIGSYDKRICIKSWQKFAYLLLSKKHRAKKQLSKRCWKESMYSSRQACANSVDSAECGIWSGSTMFAIQSIFIWYIIWWPNRYVQKYGQDICGIYGIRAREILKNESVQPISSSPY